MINPASASRFGAFILLFALLAGCANFADQEPPSGEPSFYRGLAQPGAKLDAQAAQSMISGYRRNNGLSAVVLEPHLMRMAEEQARAMAAANKLDHSIPADFQSRLRRSGYDAALAVENIGAGYYTLAEAFSGWRDSPSHRRNMLHRGVIHMGIAAVYAPNTKYKVFWSLVLAAPDEKRS
ncbi:MAG TPA: CAP domain-containing protein [Xanthobacteraceae bacterium]|nr:CAP domain-containing protein [Xanthobacteraceae bacterium]